MWRRHWKNLLAMVEHLIDESLYMNACILNTDGIKAYLMSNAKIEIFLTKSNVCLKALQYFQKKSLNLQIRNCESCSPCNWVPMWCDFLGENGATTPISRITMAHYNFDILQQLWSMYFLLAHAILEHIISYVQNQDYGIKNSYIHIKCCDMSNILVCKILPPHSS